MAEKAPQLYRSVVYRRWHEATDRLILEPHEALFTDPYGLTSLHRACYRDPPIEVISALLDIYPEATLMQDKCDQSGQTPLHSACHYACLAVVRKLLETNIAAIFKLNKHNHTPVTCMCHVYCKKIQELLEEKLRPNQTLFDLLSQDEKLLRFWKITSLLIETAYYGPVSEPRRNNKTRRIVHACVGYGVCPPNFFQLALRMHPEQLHEADDAGNLPLHIAAAALAKQGVDADLNAVKILVASHPTLAGDCEGDFSVIDALIEAYPSAAMVRNYKGKRPFTLAIESDKTWSKEVKHILEAYPGAYAGQDFDYRLYPSILALAGSESSPSLAFGLLRESPEIMLWACHEEYEKRALILKAKKVVAMLLCLLLLCSVLVLKKMSTYIPDGNEPFHIIKFQCFTGSMSNTSSLRSSINVETEQFFEEVLIATPQADDVPVSGKILKEKRNTQKKYALKKKVQKQKLVRKFSTLTTAAMDVFNNVQFPLSAFGNDILEVRKEKAEEISKREVHF